MPIRVTIWHEYRHEKKHEHIRAIYPNGMHAVLGDALKKDTNLQVRLTTLDDPQHGLTDEILDNTDVFIWWGHGHHGEVEDERVTELQKRILNGVGLIVLHSGHHSKIFKRLMGTTANLKWRVGTPPDREILWVTKPGHPITAGIDDHFVLTEEEMYGEYFDVPEPMETLLISSFTGGEVFRSGMTWTRGAGKIFYFRPGHETFRTLYNADYQRIVQNAVYWAAPVAGGKVPPAAPHSKAGWIDERLAANAAK